MLNKFKIVECRTVEVTLRCFRSYIPDQHFLQCIISCSHYIYRLSSMLKVMVLEGQCFDICKCETTGQFSSAICTFSSHVCGYENRYLWWDIGTFSQLCLQQQKWRRWDKTWSFPNPNTVFFVPKPNQTISTALSQLRIENVTLLLK